jgi:hypothetical protein
MLRNLERIDGAKETSIHQVTDGETHGGAPANRGRETPAARAHGGARLADRLLSRTRIASVAPHSPPKPTRSDFIQ